MGRENIAKIIKREYEDGNYGAMFLALQDIPCHVKGRNPDFLIAMIRVVCV